MSVDVDIDSTSFVMKYFSKLSTIKYLIFLVDYIERPNPRLMTLHKKKGGIKLNDVGSSIKATKGKQVVGFEFEYVKLVEEDTVMICLISFLECGLLG